MEARKRLARIGRIAMITLAVVGLVLPGAVTAIDPGPNGDWQVTAAAQQRTDSGECGGSGTCVEWCLNGEGQGDFMCMY